jgi:DNA-binding NarL/FixJ family response regulator
MELKHGSDLMPVKISLVEENQELRASFVTLLKGAPGLCCVGSHANAEEALQRIPAERPDVVLMDVNLRGMGGIECMTRLKSRLPKLRVLMLARHEHTDAGFDSLRAGASGYLLKHAPSAELIEAIEQAHAGGALMTMQIARKIMDYIRESRTPIADKLTPCEHTIIGLIAKGYTYAEIAGSLSLNVADVRQHIHLVYQKLQHATVDR